MRTQVASAFDVIRNSVLCFVTVASLRAFGSGTVTNCTEANLRAALAGGGTAVFACSGNLAISNTIVVSTNTLILGSGYNVTIDGGSSVQLFQLSTNISLEIHDLILANGASIGTNGLSGSQPTSGGPGFGGGILNSGGALTLIGCTLTNLTAIGGNGGQPPIFGPGTSGSDGYGGAICNLGGNLYLTNCTLWGNQASGGVGSALTYMISGQNGGQAWGGAIYCDGGVVALDHVIFSGNLASGGGWVAGTGLEVLLLAALFLSAALSCS